jgi:hypothetical protein
MGIFRRRRRNPWDGSRLVYVVTLPAFERDGVAFPETEAEFLDPVAAAQFASAHTDSSASISFYCSINLGD